MEETKTEYVLEDSFEVDHNELAGLRPQDCFTLGVEWEMFRQALLAKEPIDRMIHSDNLRRLTNLCNRYGRRSDSEQAGGGWVRIIVGDIVS